jgi:hypothetical protein
VKTGDEDFTVLGMPLEHNHPAIDILQPTGALVVVEGLDSAGRPGTWLLATHGLGGMTAIGMAQWARRVSGG